MHSHALLVALALALAGCGGAADDDGTRSAASNVSADAATPEESPAEAAAAAHHDSPSNPPHDFVVGGGFHAVIPGFTPPIKFAFSAQSGPLGEDPHGHVQVFSDPQAQARVTCLFVAGNRAFITTRTDAVPGGILVVDAVDNGEPGGAQPDLLRGSLIGAVVPIQGRPGCYRPLLSPVPVTNGNIVVHDATN
jgi:hypothetical protein